MVEDVFRKNMIRVCMLGGIGSGKSFISKLFNYPVFNADKEVNFIYKKSRICFKKLNKKIPKYIKSFPILKSELISAISENDRNLKVISSIVHPMVRKKLKNFIKINKNRKMVILDVPLLLENKLNLKSDVLIFVNSKKKKIYNRLKRRKNFNQRLLNSLLDNQAILSKKRKIANYIVENNFSPNIMKKKINILKKKIIDERSST